MPSQPKNHTGGSVSPWSQNSQDAATNAGGTALYNNAQNSQDAAINAGGTALYNNAQNVEMWPDVKSLFQRWYVEPLRTLEQLPEGNGGWIALMVSIALYERFARHVLRTGPEPLTDAQIRMPQLAGQLSRDFDIADERLCVSFWESFRHGLLHHAMPIQKKDSGKAVSIVEYNLHGAYAKSIQKDGDRIGVQPWKFMHTVLSLYEKNDECLVKDLASLFPSIKL